MGRPTELQTTLSVGFGLSTCIIFASEAMICKYVAVFLTVFVSRITYTVLVETLNPAQSNPFSEFWKLNCNF